MVIVLFQVASIALAERDTAVETSGQEASLSESQATLASLFGRGAKMPSIPRINGTIALPSFDSSGLRIDEAALSQASRAEPSAGNGEQKPS